MTLPDDFSLPAAAYYPQAEAGCLQIAGPDAAAFLQRQSTNDVRSLAPNRSILTVLTAPTGRILDVLRLVPDGAVIRALTLPGYVTSTTRFLKSRIFFMDKVTVEDASPAWFQVDVEGAQAGALLAGLGLGPPGLDGVAEGRIAAGGVDFPVIAIGQPGLSGVGFHLLAPAAARQALEAALAAAGALRLSQEMYERLRVEAGLPAARAELSEAYTPLEVGLKAAVSGSKGCYTGQEVIARQLTYDKVTQQLAGLRLQSPVAPGDSVRADGRPVGKVTSFVLSPTFGPIALSVLKRPYHAPGQVVQVGPEGNAVPATVSALPFSAGVESAARHLTAGAG